MLQASKKYRLAVIACIFVKSNYASTSSASPLLVEAEFFIKLPQQNDILPTYIVKEPKGSDACKQKNYLEVYQMKKILGRILAFCVAFSCIFISGNAYAIETTESVTIPEDTFYNEGLAYIKSKSVSDDELLLAGMDEQEIAELRSFSMEDALLERATLPDTTLYAYGYTDEQIDLLREYDGSPLTQNSAVLAATSDCVGKYDIGNYSTSQISFTYTWRWNIVPLIKMNDTVVIAWQGVSKDGNVYIDLTPSTNIMYLHFYEMMSGKRAYSQDSSVNGLHVSSEDYAYYKFGMTKNDNYYWAKEGVVYLTLYPEGSSTQINYIDLGAGYGHQTFSAEYTFSVSASLDISFSSSIPEIVVTKVDAASGRVDSKGNCTNFGSTV